MQRKETETEKFCLFRSCFKTCEIVLLACCCGLWGCNFIVHCVDTAKTTITLYIINLKMVGLETNFENTRPISHHVETRSKTISLSSRPRPRPQKLGLETKCPRAHMALRPNVCAQMSCTACLQVSCFRENMGEKQKMMYTSAGVLFLWKYRWRAKKSTFRHIFLTTLSHYPPKNHIYPSGVIYPQVGNHCLNLFGEAFRIRVRKFKQNLPEKYSKKH